jgi:AcrR family transcriptional regulator
VWTASYVQPIALHRWRNLHPVRLPSWSPAGSSLLAVTEQPEHRGLSPEQAADQTRARILLAVARLAEERGYAATTVAGIAACAGLTPRRFYRYFADKQDAFAALHEHQFRGVMGVTAGAFFSQADWPARIWAASRAFAAYLQRNPTLARTWFIESFAGDPVGRRRVEELNGAFSLFLQDGYQDPQLCTAPAAFALDAIVSTTFELHYRFTRAERMTDLAGLVPHVTFLSLAPFFGADHANARIDTLIGSAGQLRRPPA